MTRVSPESKAKDIKRRSNYKDKAMCGLIPPDMWVICPQCGTEVPLWFGFHWHKRKANREDYICHSWMSNCANIVKGEASKRNTFKVGGQKYLNFRLGYCVKEGQFEKVICTDYEKCLDRNIFNHTPYPRESGEECFKPPGRPDLKLGYVSALIGVHTNARQHHS